MTQEEIKSIKDLIEILSQEQTELKFAYQRYLTVTSQLDDLHEKVIEENYNQNRSNLTRECQYLEPDYPSMGYPSVNGSAVFKDEQQAKDLLKILIKRSYYYGYELEWSGPGNYIVEPSYSYDHDGEIIYTATFKKEIE